MVHVILNYQFSISMRSSGAESASCGGIVIFHFHPLRSVYAHEQALRDPFAAFHGHCFLCHVLHLDHQFILLAVVIVVDDAE